MFIKINKIIKNTIVPDPIVCVTFIGEIKHTYGFSLNPAHIEL